MRIMQLRMVALLLGFVLLAARDGRSQTAAIAAMRVKLDSLATGYAHQVEGLIELPRGRLLVLLRGDPFLFIVGLDSKIQRVLGRGGDGPGEFRSPLTIGIHGDSVWVWDRRHFRLTWFDSDGSRISTLPAAPPNSSLVYALSDGGFLSVDAAARILDPALAPRGAAAWRWSADFANRRLIDSLRSSRVLRLQIGASVLVRAQPFDERPTVHVSPNGAFVVSIRSVGECPSATGRACIVWRGPDGRVLGRASLAGELRPLTNAMVTARAAEIRQQILAGIRQQDLRAVFERTSVADIRSALYRPPTLPAVGSALVCTDGSVWLGESATTESTVRWESIHHSGTRGSTLILPRDARAMYCSGRQLWVVRSDESELPVLEAHPIPR